MITDGLLTFTLYGSDGYQDNFDLQVRQGGWTSNVVDNDIADTFRRRWDEYQWFARQATTIRNVIRDSLLASDLVNVGIWNIPVLDALPNTRFKLLFVAEAKKLMQPENFSSTMTLLHQDHCGEDNWELYHQTRTNQITVKDAFKEIILNQNGILMSGSYIQFGRPSRGPVNFHVMRRNEEITGIRIVV